MENIIEIDGISYAYSASEGERGEPALKNISLQIEKGSFTAIVGRNGSGKSTLAKHMNGLLLPDSGRVLVKGMDTKNPENIWGVRQAAGMVFQNPDNQIVASIVEEDVAFGPENIGVPRPGIISRVERSLESVGMLKYRRRAPHMLSGGQKQRVAIAGVLALHPEIVIFDESTAMLDPLGRREVIDAARSLHEEGITVILITHFMDEAMLTGRIIVMDRGNIAMDGTPEEIFSDMEKLKGYGLVPPPMVVLGAMLGPKYQLPLAMDVDKMADALCRYVLKM